MKDGLILDGPAKGHHLRCNLDYAQVPEDFGKEKDIFFIGTAELGHRLALQRFEIVYYKKVWLERGTVYAWILR